jgi:hypothetical protein
MVYSEIMGATDIRNSVTEVIQQQLKVSYTVARMLPYFLQ